jgi:coenzyme F420-reducing hydrogenase delta subunit
MRLQYPPEIEIILVPCTGRVDIIHLLEAFEKGADAVFVAGCLEGECHYLTGNFRAKKRVKKVKLGLSRNAWKCSICLLQKAKGGPPYVRKCPSGRTGSAPAR